MSTASAPAGFVVLRSSGHSGSRWLSELLATQNLTSLFEFPGRCSGRYAGMANASLHHIFATACSCHLDEAMESVCSSDEDGRIKSMSCIKGAYCSQRCPPGGTRSSTCRGVGMVDSYQPALARRLLAARAAGPVVVATFERDNAVKHAISKLRASCGGTRLKGNHLKRGETPAGLAAGGDNGTDAGVALGISAMHIEPQLLLAEATQVRIHEPKSSNWQVGCCQRPQGQQDKPQ